MHPVAASIVAKLAPHRRPVWVPETRRGEGDPRGSRYFGRPWMNDDEEWPCRDGEPMSFVLQLDVASLPAPVRGTIGGHGILRLWYAEAGEWPRDGDVSRLVHAAVADPSAPGGPREPPRCADIGPATAIFGWRETFEAPHAEDYAMLGIDLTREERSALIELAGAMDEVARGRAEGAAADRDLTEAELDALADSLDRRFDAWQRGEDSGGRPEADDADRAHALALVDLGFSEEDVAALVDATWNHGCDKLGGWECWTRGAARPVDSAGRPMVPVYQISADAAPFDGGPAHVPGLFASRGTGHLHRSPRTGELRFGWACG